LIAGRERFHHTPADVYFGRGRTILLERERIKRDTIKQRRLQHQSKAASWFLLFTAIVAVLRQKFHEAYFDLPPLRAAA
jgi:hypothetical protein